MYRREYEGTEESGNALESGVMFSREWEGT